MLPDLADATLVQHVSLGPTEGFLVWRREGRLWWVSWNGASCDELTECPHRVLSHPPTPMTTPPVVLTPGEATTIALETGQYLLAAGLPVQPQEHELVIQTDQHKQHGDYQVVIADHDRWTAHVFKIRPALGLRLIEARVNPDGKDQAVVCEVENARPTNASVSLAITLPRQNRPILHNTTIPARRSARIEVPVAATTAGLVVVEATAGDQERLGPAAVELRPGSTGRPLE